MKNSIKAITHSYYDEEEAPEYDEEAILNIMFPDRDDENFDDEIDGCGQFMG